MADDKDDKKKAVPHGKDLMSLKDAINTYFKNDVGRMASDAGDKINITHLYSTGILSLDKYLGIGGLLGGRIVNSFGHEGTGKTLTALTIAAHIQKTVFTPCPGNANGEGRVAFLDAEGSYSPEMAKSVGVDTSKLLIYQSTPERILTGEDYFDIIKILIQNNIELIIVDSAPALVPSSRMNAVLGQGQKATHAAMMAEGLQTITPLLNGFKRSVVYIINQMRMKPMQMFGSPEGATGGEALKFFESYALEVKKRGDIIKKVLNSTGQYEERRIGVTVEAKLNKNKTASIPCDPIQYDVYFENVIDEQGVTYYTGVDVYKDVVQVGIMTGVIEKSSSWYNYGLIKGNGEANFIELLRAADPTVMQEIRTKVLTGSK
jgi:recombination protein RecA